MHLSFSVGIIWKVSKARVSRWDWAGIKISKTWFDNTTVADIGWIRKEGEGIKSERNDEGFECLW